METALSVGCEVCSFHTLSLLHWVFSDSFACSVSCLFVRLTAHFVCKAVFRPNQALWRLVYGCAAVGVSQLGLFGMLQCWMIQCWSDRRHDWPLQRVGLCFSKSWFCFNFWLWGCIIIFHVAYRPHHCSLNALPPLKCTGRRVLNYNAWFSLNTALQICATPLSCIKCWGFCPYVAATMNMTETENRVGAPLLVLNYE